ncbi:hypothetical protein ES703_43440 [subsurface metagenome]
MKAKFGAIVVAGRGKIGGHVASRNRAGSYFRTKVTPVNPQSTAQTTVRNRFGGLSSFWRGLTSDQLAAWNAAVGDFAKTDIFGDLRNPTGAQLFQRLNNNLLACGEPQIDTPPLVTAVDAFTSIELTAEDGTVTESLSLVIAPAVGTDHLVKVYATPPLSAGISFVKSEYRLVDIMPADQASPYDALTAYQAVFGSTGAAGQKIFMKCIQVEQASGLAGVPIATSAIVTVSAA